VLPVLVGDLHCPLADRDGHEYNVNANVPGDRRTQSQDDVMARTVLPSVLFSLLTLTPAMLAQKPVDALGDPLPEGAIARVGTNIIAGSPFPK
jgi:hypothetical protein